MFDHLRSELLRIKRHATKGDESAAKYLKLLEMCVRLLENADGVSLARGLAGEHDDVYMGAIDDALSELVPVIVEIAANGMESIQWYLPDQGVGQIPEHESE
jgi:hypothetical protein